MTLRSCGFEYNSTNVPTPTFDDAVWGPLSRVPFAALSDLGDWMWRNPGKMICVAAAWLAIVVLVLAVGWRVG